MSFYKKWSWWPFKANCVQNSGNNNSVNFWDFLGQTTVGEILDSYFSNSTAEQLWIMGENDEYTERVRYWGAVQSAVQAARSDLKQNCNVWETNHLTDNSWKPGRTDPPVTSPNAWKYWVSSPPGTEPDTAGIAYVTYRTFGIQIDSLWTSAIGSFGIYVTVGKIDCCKKTAEIEIWMYNAMDRESFGRFADHWYFRNSGQARQYMWWNWTEKNDWK
ncbi:MAG: hypothetical protein ABIK15_15215 [Pseudomonadota bacterium]